MSKIKICGLFREIDIDYVNQTKPDYVGFIINFPKSHRSIDFDTAKMLISKLDKNIKSVCVFVNQPNDYIRKFDFADIIQLHGDEDNDFIKNLKKNMPDHDIWKAFRIQNEIDIQKAKNSIADMIMLDNGYGTGRVFDWSNIRDINRDYILAGGISADNIQEASYKLNPFGFDLSSGVETDKIKDIEKIKQVIKKVRSKGNE